MPAPGYRRGIPGDGYVGQYQGVTRPNRATLSILIPTGVCVSVKKAAPGDFVSRKIGISLVDITRVLRLAVINHNRKWRRRSSSGTHIADI